MTKSLRVSALVLLVATVSIAAFIVPAHATDYNNSRLMDDQIFDNNASMNESQIQSFLSARGSCLASYNDVDPTWTGSTWTYGGSASAAHTIYKVSQQWGLNPQVIIATLQKEQSLITGAGLCCSTNNLCDGV